MSYQQYFHCFIVCILVLYPFWFSYQQNMVTILVSAASRGVVLIRGEALISMWISKSALLICDLVLIRGNMVYVYIERDRQIHKQIDRQIDGWIDRQIQIQTQIYITQKKNHHILVWRYQNILGKHFGPKKLQKKNHQN